MTPDEYRKNYPSCRTCEYFREESSLLNILKQICLVTNSAPIYRNKAKKCKCYKPIPFKEEKN